MMKKSLLVATVLATTLSTGLALAERGDGEREGCKRGHWGHHGNKGFHRGAEMMEREFTAEQIRTLVEARLLMKGNENLQIGQIIPTDTGYTITIVTQDGSLVEEKEVAMNGMPLKLYERIKERMAKRDADLEQ